MAPRTGVQKGRMRMVLKKEHIMYMQREIYLTNSKDDTWLVNQCI